MTQGDSSCPLSDTYGLWPQGAIHFPTYPPAVQAVKPAKWIRGLATSPQRSWGIWHVQGLLFAVIVIPVGGSLLRTGDDRQPSGT